MKLVLHIGMHKTGTSSIQSAFAPIKTGSVQYLQMGHENHSSFFATMFMDAPETYRAHRNNKRSAKRVQELKAEYLDSLDRHLAGATCETMIVSGEGISALGRSELERMKAVLEAHTTDIDIFGYVRPPASYMSSSLQQNVVGGLPLGFRNLAPNYRKRFEKFDDIFGRERVTLIRFDRATLKDGNVVSDFAERMGVDRSLLGADDVNESKSLETIAVLAAQRRHGRGLQPYPGAPVDNVALVEMLAPLGRTRLTLHRSVVLPVLEAHADDIRWASDRLGTNLLDEPADTPGAMRSEDDILEQAGPQFDAVMRLVSDNITRGGYSAEATGLAADLLLQILKENRRKTTSAARLAGFPMRERLISRTSWLRKRMLAARQHWIAWRGAER